MKQQRLFKDKTKKYFGGSLLKKSNPKTKRPFSPKAAMHFVLKARYFCLSDPRIKSLILKEAHKRQIKIYQLQIMTNHIHIVLKSKAKENLNHFLRVICGLIPKLLQKTKLWLYRPFSRIVGWGRDYKGIKNYMVINLMQIKGYTKEKARVLLTDTG